MTPEERIAAKKIARIMRAARKQQGLTQQAVASQLGISQGALSKLEHGTLVPSAPQWFEFCQLTGIASDSLMSGFIERARPLADLGNRDGTFRLARKYTQNRGSKVRAMLPFLMYLKDCLGEKKYIEYLKHVQVDHDFLVDLDNQLSLEFSLDITRYLIGKKKLKMKDIARLTKPVATSDAHGGLGVIYQQQGGRSTAGLLTMLISNSKRYESNFRYEIQDQRRNFLDLSVTPEAHMESIHYHDDVLGDFVCRYKQSYFETFTSFGGAQGLRRSEVEHPECHYKGAERCVYRIPLSAA